MKQGWTYKRLKELYPIVMGKTPPRAESKFWDPNKETHNLWVSIADLSKNEGKEITETKEYISNEAIGNITKVPKGSLLVSFKLTLGKMAFAGDDLYTNEAIMSLGKRDDIDLKFLYYYFSSLDWGQLATGNEKVKGKTLNKKSLGEIPVAMLSKAEQGRIVERLDAVFAQIDELKSNAEKQLAEARALFQSALTQAMQPKPGWQEKKIKDIADVKGGKRVPKGYKLQSTNTNHPYIRVADFNNYGTIEMSDIQYISDEIFEQIKNYTITDQDLYVSIAGTIGKTGIIPSELNGANLTENACKLVFKDDINLRFVYLFTLSEIFKKQVEKATKQASQPKLALTRLAEVKISVPSIIEQQQIVSCLDFISNHVKELEEISRKTAAECDAMKQALLRQIFE